MPHTLEFTNDPHQVLREVDRVLIPEGHVVILAFNPWSLWYDLVAWSCVGVASRLGVVVLSVSHA